MREVLQLQDDCHGGRFFRKFRLRRDHHHACSSGFFRNDSGAEWSDFFYDEDESEEEDKIVQATPTSLVGVALVTRQLYGTSV